MDGADWTWSTTKDPPGVESSTVDRSLRLSSAHVKAFMLSSLPSTATTTHLKFPVIVDSSFAGECTTPCFCVCVSDVGGAVRSLRR